MKKKVVFSIIGLLFSFVGICQVPNSQVIDATLPKGTVSLSKEQASTMLHNNFKRYEVPTNSKYLDIKNYYQMDGLLVAFWDDEVNPQFKRSLETIRSGIMGVFRYTHDTVNFSKIITLNNINFLEYEFKKEDEVYLWFQSDVNKNDKNICGVIQFKKGNEDKAQKYLDDFLGTVRFK
jgi:hypothetical protein